MFPGDVDRTLRSSELPSETNVAVSSGKGAQLCTDWQSREAQTAPNCEDVGLPAFTVSSYKHELWRLSMQLYCLCVNTVTLGLSIFRAQQEDFCLPPRGTCPARRVSTAPCARGSAPHRSPAPTPYCTVDTHLSRAWSHQHDWRRKNEVIRRSSGCDAIAIAITPRPRRERPPDRAVSKQRCQRWNVGRYDDARRSAATHCFDRGT